MKRILLFASLFLLINSCEKEDLNLKFDAFKVVFVDELWKMYPGMASSVGFHNYDSLLDIPDAQGRQRELVFAEEKLKELSAFNMDELSDNNKTDYFMIENQLKRNQWTINKEKSFEWNPANFNICGLFAEMLINNYDSLDTRLHNFGKRLALVPAYYQAAMQNVKSPVKEFTELAIAQNSGGSSVFDNDLKLALEASRLTDSEKQLISTRATEAITAINDYVEWLKNLKNETPRDFRLGKDLYPEKFDYDIQSGYTFEQIYEKAIARKKLLHDKMAELADKVWTKYMKSESKPSDRLVMIKQVMDKISLRHSRPDSLQIAIEQQIPELEKFVREKDLLYLDPSKPLVVRKEPAYMAGVAVASISSPGPYDKNGNTYYNVGSVEGWDPARAESHLREYNHYLLQILNIHEAIPGHYAQLVYSNTSPSIIKSILGNGAMVEGWAVYTELMMLENGYGNNEPELWLMYYKFNLRTVCNTILDISIHTGQMTRDEMMNLLINEAFQQEAEASGKWRRASLSSVQLCSYFTGFTEIYDLREELKQKQGAQFDLKKFHEKFLSYGSAPVKYIRKLMLAELTQ